MITEIKKGPRKTDSYGVLCFGYNTMDTTEVWPESRKVHIHRLHTGRNTETQLSETILVYRLRYIGIIMISMLIVSNVCK